MGAQLDPAGPDAAVAQLAARQHGVVTYGQLMVAGLGRRAIERRARIGWLHRMHRGVYAVGHRPRDAHLVTLGYRVLRFTERQVTADTEIVAARLGALLPTSASR